MQAHPTSLNHCPSTPLERTITPGVYRRGDRYVAVWRDAGRQHKTSFATLLDAQQAKSAHDARQHLPLARVGFQQYVEAWIETYRGRTRRGVTRSTRADYRRSLYLYAIPYFQTRRLVDIAPRDVRDYVDHLELLEQAPSSVRKNFAPVRALLATAVEDGVLPANPASVIRVVGARNGWEDKERDVLTRRELADFLAAVPDEWEPFFQLLVKTGLRISEVLGLTWGDLNLTARQPSLTVRRQIYRGHVGPPKTRYGRRTIPLSRGLCQRLSAIREASRYAGDEDPVFVTPRGTPLDVSNVRRRVLRPAATAAGLGSIGFHVFRHTCASLLFDAGRNIKQVQAWLGHHDPAFTLSTYVHLVERGLGDADFVDDLAPERTHELTATCDPQVYPGPPVGRRTAAEGAGPSTAVTKVADR